MKDALTYAHDAGFFSFNVVGWKAEFERMIQAVRADAIADHIRDATKMVTLTAEQAQQIEEALDESYAELSADSHRDGPRCLILTTLETAIASIHAAKAQEPLSTNLDVLPTNLAEQESIAWGNDKFAPHERQQKQPVSQEPTADVFKFLLGEGELDGCSFGERNEAHRGNFWWRKHLRRALAEQAEQEPVAWLIPGAITGDKKLAEANGKYATPLYTAPVRTKDLTDDEIFKIFYSDGKEPIDNYEFARAVIAADRRKNK
jgi:hypothetical protein